MDVAALMGHKDVVTTLRFYAHAIPGDNMDYIDRLTAARQAMGNLNGDFVEAGHARKRHNSNKLLAPRAGLEPATS